MCILGACIPTFLLPPTNVNSLVRVPRVCVCVYVLVCTYVRECVCACVFACSRMYLCLSVCVLDFFMCEFHPHRRKNEGKEKNMNTSADPFAYLSRTARAPFRDPLPQHYLSTERRLRMRPTHKIWNAQTT